MIGGVVGFLRVPILLKAWKTLIDSELCRWPRRSLVGLLIRKGLESLLLQRCRGL